MAHFKPTNRHRSSSSFCHCHPSLKPTTGFCPSCLHERLSTIQTLSSPSPQPPRLRSYSVRNTSNTASEQQPRRRSCDDARANTNSLHDLFLDDDVTSIRKSLVPELKEENDSGDEYKTMKEFIDLDYGNQIKKNNNNGFTKKLKNVIGRRSCDVDPFERSSFEKPRVSWDGCLIEKTYSKLTPLCTVIEDGKDLQEKVLEEEEEEKSPGGGVQTRDYYSESRRRKELLEVDELKTVGLFHGAKLLVTEKELRDSKWYSMKSHKTECVELGNICVGASDGKVDGVEVKKAKKKWPKGWNLWGLIHRKNETKNDVKTEQSLKLEGNAVEGSLAESLLKLRKVAKGETNGCVSEKLSKSYNVSARKSCDGVFSGANIVSGRSSCDGLFHGSINSVDVGRSSCDGFLNGIEGKQNHHTNARESVDNSLLRFYLTPLSSHKSSKSVKSRLMN